MPERERGRSRWLWLTAIAASVLVADQLTKWWAVDALSDRSIDVVWTLRFHLVFNMRSAFNIGGGDAWGPLVAALAVVVVGVLLWYARSGVSRIATLALGLVVGGTLGNLGDRAFRGDEGFLRGPVVDFIDLQWWPVFNIADSAVVVGVLLLIAAGLRRPEPAGEAASEQAPRDA